MHTAFAVVVLVVPGLVEALQSHVGNNKGFESTKSRDGRPNILFLMTDSMDGRVVDPLSIESKAVDMPFVRDFLGKQGANFVKSYSNNPMCVPSRTSMMTGRTSYQLGIWGNRAGLAASPEGVLDDMCVKNNGKEQCEEWAKAQGHPQHVLSAFRNLGYKVHMDGRSHIGAGMLNAEDHAGKIEGHQTCDCFDEMRLGEVTRSADIRNSPGGTFTKVFLEDAVETGQTLSGGGDTFFGLADWLAVDNCNRFISDLPSPSEATEPFFLHCSFNLPHYTFSTNSTWLDKVHGDKLVLPTWNKGFPDAWHPYDSFMSTAKGLDGDFANEDIKKLMRVYYGMVAESDAMLQKVWDALVAKGYGLHNTYVVFVSDHGEMKFEHRQIYKATLYEGSARVPIQLAGPGIKEGQRIDTHLTSLLDIFPTLLDMAGENLEAKYKGLMGRSLLAAAGGQSVAPASMKLNAIQDSRDLVVSHYNWVEGNTGAFMVRSGPWKMMTYGHTYEAYKNYPAQLYDLNEDPEELHNLATEKPEVVAKLDKQLREVMDPDEVDRWVMQDDFERLKARFGGKVDPKAPDVQKLVKLQDRSHFSNWVTEAKNLFGSPHPSALHRVQS